MDISPDKQNLDSLFSNTVFYIDFYQREYKWNKDPVERLLDDIFFKFNIEYDLRKSDETIPSKEVVNNYYPWYYLNTYVINVIDGKVYIVDGQQRLTTLSLILIKLFHLTAKYESKLLPWVERKIVGYSGPKQEFWMNHVKHLKTLEALLTSDSELKRIPVSSGIGAENMVTNYSVISKWLDEHLDSKHKLETFIFYFLYRLVLINLAVEQTNVPMVFEVINDRGVKLKPYEILKGKLLGLIDKLDLEKLNLNELWDGQVNAINGIDDDGIDYFFWSFLRARYTEISADFNKVSESNYHRAIFTEDFNKKLKLKNNPKEIKDFLLGEFKYYTNLHIRVLKAYYTLDKKFPHVFFNSLNDQNTQFMLILSCCKLNDPLEEVKIQQVSAELDRFFSLLRLQKAYDSNRFNDMILEITVKIRDSNPEDLRSVFDDYLIREINYSNELTNENKPFSYTYFKETSNKDLPSRFLRYFFARIENFIAEGINQGMKYPFQDLVLKTGSVNGFHVEHIISDSDVNFELFGGDEEVFYRERNRLGGLLLLRGRDNQSSGDEPYKNKLKTYANTLYWNESLREDSYKSKKDLSDFISKTGLQLRPITEQFGPDELEERHKLLAKMVEIIWK